MLVDDAERRRCASRGPATRSRGRWRAATRAPSGTSSTRPTCGCRCAPSSSVGLFDWRRPWRLVHLDLLVLLSFGISQMFFNRGEIGVSVPLVYPVLVYLLARMLWIGFRGPGGGLRPSSPIVWLAVAAAFLVGFRIALNVADSGVIDVGYSGVIGADRVVDGRSAVRRGGVPRRQSVRRHLRPRQLLRLRPLRARSSRGRGSGTSFRPPTRRRSSSTSRSSAMLFVLGRRLRPGRGGRELGVDPRLRLGGVPVHRLRAAVERQRLAGRGARARGRCCCSPRRWAAAR